MSQPFKQPRKPKSSLPVDKKPFLVYKFYYGDSSHDNTKRQTVTLPNINALHLFDENIRLITRRGHISVFNDVLEELSVMKCTMNETEDENWNEMIQHQTLTERFGKLTEEYQKYTNHKNTLRHLCEIYNIVYAGFLELIGTWSLNSLLNNIKVFMQLMDDEATLIEDTAANKQMALKLKVAIVKERKALLSLVAKRKYKVFKTKEYLEDIRAYGHMELNYTINWETARLEQKLYQLKLKEDYFKNKRSNYQLKINQEKRIHFEIERYIGERSDDLRAEIEFWMEQYDAESDHKENDMGKLRVEIELLKETLEKTKEEYEFRVKFIEERRALKEQRKEEEALRRRKLAATYLIQAWWRGARVRNCLGRYKKLKKKMKALNKTLKKIRAAFAKQH